MPLIRTPYGTRTTFHLDPSYFGPGEAIAWALRPEELRGEGRETHLSPATFPIPDSRPALRGRRFSGRVEDGIHDPAQVVLVGPTPDTAPRAIDHGATLRIDGEVTRRAPSQKGFKVTPRRWVVERTFGWLMRHRRLARDYETHPHRSEAMIKVAMIDVISRRRTRNSTPNWRDT